jgi:hypothetical protein
MRNGGGGLRLRAGCRQYKPDARGNQGMEVQFHFVFSVFQVAARFNFVLTFTAL